MAVSAIVLALFAWRLVLPEAISVFADGKRIAATFSFVAKADSMAAMASALSDQANILDSLLKTGSDTVMVSEQAIPGAIYEIVGRSGIKTSKVEIGKRITTPVGFQIPVTVAAEGGYSACGTFIEGIEHLKPAARIRDLDLKNADHGRVALTVDFVFLSQK